LVHVRVDENLPRGLFRFLHPNGGLSYVEVFFGANRNGDITVEDIYPLISGEKMSQGFRRMVIQKAIAGNAQELPALSATEKLRYAHAKEILNLMQCVQQNRKREGYVIYAQLPMELRKERTILLMGIVAAKDFGDAEFLQEMERYRVNHPNDPAMDLVSLTLFEQKKEFKNVG